MNALKRTIISSPGDGTLTGETGVRGRHARAPGTVARCCRGRSAGLPERQILFFRGALMEPGLPELRHDRPRHTFPGLSTTVPHPGRSRSGLRQWPFPSTRRSMGIGAARPELTFDKWSAETDHCTRSPYPGAPCPGAARGVPPFSGKGTSPPTDQARCPRQPGCRHRQQSRGPGPPVRTRKHQMGLVPRTRKQVGPQAGSLRFQPAPAAGVRPGRRQTIGGRQRDAVDFSV